MGNNPFITYIIFIATRASVFIYFYKFPRYSFIRNKKSNISIILSKYEIFRQGCGLEMITDIETLQKYCTNGREIFL